MYGRWVLIWFKLGSYRRKRMPDPVAVLLFGVALVIVIAVAIEA